MVGHKYNRMLLGIQKGQTSVYNEQELKCFKLGSTYSMVNYRTRVIITRGFYTFYPLFEVQNKFFKGAFFKKFWSYVWLVFKNGF